MEEWAKAPGGIPKDSFRRNPQYWYVPSSKPGLLMRCEFDEHGRVYKNCEHISADTVNCSKAER
ncbi:MAG: hypothetical protein ABJQ63_12155, partial [Lentilitoribacter sp.]